MNETKPKRRWFRFSLRALLVVVTIISIPLAWFGYHLNWIADRHKARDWARQHGVEYHYPDGDPIQVNWTLSVLGEVGIPEMIVHMGKNESKDGLNELIRLYPECHVGVFPD